MFPAPQSGDLPMADRKLQSKMKAVLQNLEALRTEHQTMRLNFSAGIISDPDKEEIVNRNFQNIDLGIGEVRLIIALMSHLQNIDVERQKLRLQVKRLCQENTWLRDEVQTSQKFLLKSELLVVQLEEEKKQLEFAASVKKYDDFLEGEDIREKLNGDPTLELFPEDEPSDRRLSKLSPTSSINFGDYEVSARLRTIHNLAIHYASQGKYEVAVPLCKQALEDLEREHGHEHPDVATMLNILALVYRDQGNYKEATRLMSEALEIRVRCLGECHPSVAATLNNLAVLYGKNGRYKDAEPLCKRALAIRENVLGGDHPDVAKQLNNLALLCQNQGKHGEVEVYSRKALDIFEMQLGVDDPNVTKTKCNLAACCLKLRKYKEAEELLKEVLLKAHDKEFAEAHDGEQNGETVDNATYGKTGAWHETAPVYSPTVKTVVKHLATLCHKQGKFEAADRLKHDTFRSKNEILDVLGQA
ncbi:kinesin light chain-like [Ochlerotatus camptorhynchus]|uniref:kinesin light chain-like n=1 Tax=Ochlerotatus camptorhynchus TaxID=644619 RepID=UPI0031E09515